MTVEGSRPCQGDGDADIDHLAWTVAESLLQAQTTGYRAMEDYLLMMHYHDSSTLGERDLGMLIDDAIEAHAEIIEDLECARESMETLIEQPVSSP